MHAAYVIIPFYFQYVCMCIENNLGEKILWKKVPSTPGPQPAKTNTITSKWIQFFPLNPGCLIGLLIMVYYNSPHNWVGNLIPNKSPKQPTSVFFSTKNAKKVPWSQWSKVVVPCHQVPTQAMATKDLVYNYRGIQVDPSIENNDRPKKLRRSSCFCDNSSSRQLAGSEGCNPAVVS